MRSPIKLANYLAPTLAGAGLGVLAGFGQSVSASRNEGASWSDALKGGLKRGLQGAVVGGAVGAGVRRFSPDMAEGLTNYGHKTLYSLTGHLPQGKSLADLGGGSGYTQGILDNARKAVLESKATEQHAAQEAFRRALDSHKAVVDAEQSGLTNLPGLVKGLVTPSRTLDTVRKAAKGTWAGTDTLGKALILSPLIGGAASIATDPSEEDPRSRLRKAVEIGGTTALNLATAPLQMATTAKSVTGSLLGQITAGTGVNHMMTLPIQELARKVDVPPPLPRPTAEAG